MLELTKKHPTKNKFIFLAKDTQHVYTNVPVATLQLILRKLTPFETSAAPESDDNWDNLFEDSRARVGGVKAYQKAAAVVRGYRNRDGITQNELAKRLGSSQSNVSAIENAKDPIGKKLAKKLAKIFNTNYEIFLTDL